MDTISIREKLFEYIKFASDEKVEALYISVKDELATGYQWWKDEDLIAELDKRSADLNSGKDPGFTWEESKALLKARLKK